MFVEEKSLIKMKKKTLEKSADWDVFVFLFVKLKVKAAKLFMCLRDYTIPKLFLGETFCKSSREIFRTNKKISFHPHSPWLSDAWVKDLYQTNKQKCFWVVLGGRVEIRNTIQIRRNKISKCLCKRATKSLPKKNHHPPSQRHNKLNFLLIDSN